MEPAYVITFTVMFTLLFFMTGGIIGWLTYRHFLENKPPYLHPEFFDDNGQIIPDEVVAVSFNPDYFIDENEDDDEEEEVIEEIDDEEEEEIDDESVYEDDD